MRFPAAILIAACALAAGCTSLASRTRERDRDKDRIDRPDDRMGDRPWWQNGTENAANDKSRPALAKNDREGIIAGELFDAREGRRLRGKTYIIVRPAEETASAPGRKDMGVETDEDGYFFMPMLTPGRTYILSAVREVDGRKIAGEIQIKPPAGNIRLELDEGKVSSVTPPLPPPPSMGPFEKSGSPRPPAPGDPPAADRGWESGTGVPHIEPPPPPLNKESIAGNPMLPPMAAIRPPPAPVPAAPSRKVDDESPRAPVQRVPNFAVSDLTGGDWEFRYADGRLILMEFWGTTCAPCQRAMPSMKRLQADYGGSGLEIVAVACEDGNFAARAKAVDELSRKKDLNYKVYLEPEGRVGEVQRLFSIQWIPTLVLLDRQGIILWRGGATDPEIARLDDIIRTYLTKR
jgi:thiol-disulfide isomerase/thioredoxin